MTAFSSLIPHSSPMLFQLIPSTLIDNMATSYQPIPWPYPSKTASLEVTVASPDFFLAAFSLLSCFLISYQGDLICQLLLGFLFYSDVCLVLKMDLSTLTFTLETASLGGCMELRSCVSEDTGDISGLHLLDVSSRCSSKPKHVTI